MIKVVLCLEEELNDEACDNLLFLVLNPANMFFLMNPPFGCARLISLLVFLLFTFDGFLIFGEAPILCEFRFNFETFNFDELIFVILGVLARCLYLFTIELLAFLVDNHESFKDCFLWYELFKEEDLLPLKKDCLFTGKRVVFNLGFSFDEACSVFMFFEMEFERFTK